MNRFFGIVIIFGISSLTHAAQKLTEAQKTFLRQVIATRALQGTVPATVGTLNTQTVQAAHPELAKKLTQSDLNLV